MGSKKRDLRKPSAIGRNANPSDLAAHSRPADVRQTLKVQAITPNYHKRCFEIQTAGRSLTFPFALLPQTVDARNRVKSVSIDEELGGDGFTYELDSGETETVLFDEVLHFNADPTVLNEHFLFQLTREVHKALDESRLGKRALIRRLGTSASQFYRLLDTTNFKKSAGQLIALLHILGKTVEISVVPRPSSDSIR